MASTKANYRQIPDRLRGRTPFQGNSMRAERTDYPDETFEYRVYSYATEIARVTRMGEVIVYPEHYSVTTTRQQNLCRAWL